LAAGDDSRAERLALCSRLFANEICQLFSRNILRVLMGTAEINDAAVADSLAEISFSEFSASYRNVIRDMDRLADIVFGRDALAQDRGRS
jgi:hypothetical protein